MGQVTLDHVGHSKFILSLKKNKESWVGFKERSDKTAFVVTGLL